MYRKLTILGIVVFIIGLGIGINSALNFTADPIHADWVNRWFDYLTGFAVSFGIMGLAAILILYPKPKTAKSINV